MYCTDRTRCKLGCTEERKCENTAGGVNEVARMRYHLTELAKWADKAAMVLAILEAENSDEEEQIQEIIDGISTWAPDALMGPNVQGEPPRAASSREVGSTDGLGVAVQPAPTFEETK